VRQLSETIINKIKEIFNFEPEPRPYYKVRFRWWEPFDLEKFLEENKEKYEMEETPEYTEPGRIDIFKDTRIEIKLRADTLHVFLTPYRAILFQKELFPLTKKDKDLADYILERYTHLRDTPLI
jgi:hypothetical protein